MTLYAPRRQAPTYLLNGQERYADTHIPVKEPLGSHLVIQIIDDAEAFAQAIEAEGDAELTKQYEGDDGLAGRRRAVRYRRAAKIRANGPRRFWYASYDSIEEALAAADKLGARGQPGVRYEITAITDAATCADCDRPIIKAEGAWRHHMAGYPAVCTSGPNATVPPEDDESFEINVAGGTMTCGYCGETTMWRIAGMAHAMLTGYYTLRVRAGNGIVEAVAEARMYDGRLVYLPHPCDMVPDHVLAAYARQIEAAKKLTP